MFVNMMCLTDETIQTQPIDYHRPPMLPIDTLIPFDVLQPFDSLLEGIITDADLVWESFCPQSFTQLMRHYFNADKVRSFVSYFDQNRYMLKVSIVDVINWLRDCLCTNPYYIYSNHFNVGKKVTSAALPNRVCAIKTWKRMQLLIDDRFVGCHLRIANGNHASACLMAMRWSEVCV